MSANIASWDRHAKIAQFAPCTLSHPKPPTYTLAPVYTKSRLAQLTSAELSVFILELHKFGFTVEGEPLNDHQCVETLLYLGACFLNCATSETILRCILHESEQVDQTVGNNFIVAALAAKSPANPTEDGMPQPKPQSQSLSPTGNSSDSASGAS